MFTPAQRSRLRDALVSAARADARKAEIGQVDAGLAGRLASTLRELAG